jgi:hypothetical protein
MLALPARQGEANSQQPLIEELTVKHDQANLNERRMTMNKQEKDHPTLIEDLPVTDEQADETKGGASGTGKTMAAEVITRELRLDQ